MTRGVQSWGRVPADVQQAEACAWQDEAAAALRRLSAHAGATLAIGNARSYGDSCLAPGGHVLQMTGLNRIIAADWEAGVVRAEAGITLAELTRIVLPRGWFLPVIPGTKYATLGGAIANDVHGKNHHVQGTFGAHVRALGLVRSDRGAVACTPMSEAELFRATIGGLGLTGVIAWAQISLMKVASGFIDAMSVRFGGLDEFFALSGELDARHDYAVAWVDALAQGRSLGRGTYTVGNHSRSGHPDPEPATAIPVPFTPPLSPVNRLTMRVFNAAYWRASPAGRQARHVPHDRFFHPLDRFHDWNRLYGPAGFQQFQCVVPEAAAPAAIRELLAAIAGSGAASFLAVLKRCGDRASPGLMSFPMKGTSLALDFPESARPAARLFPRLDAIVRAAGGRLYPAKDAHMDGAFFREAYPRWHTVEALRDPSINSLFWRRVTT